MLFGRIVVGMQPTNQKDSNGSPHCQALPFPPSRGGKKEKKKEIERRHRASLLQQSHKCKTFHSSDSSLTYKI